MSTPTICLAFDQAAVRHPDRVAVVQDKRRYTYGHLCRCVETFASFLVSSGLTPGDRVCVALDNSPEYIVSYLAIMKSGGTVVPMSDQSTPRGIRQIMVDSGASALLLKKNMLHTHREAYAGVDSARFVITAARGDVGGENPSDEALPAVTEKKVFPLGPLLEPGHAVVPSAFPSVSADATGLIIYTSGTTGAPKGVMLSQKNLTANAGSIISYLKLTEADRVMVVLPFYYSYGNSLLTTHLTVGGCLVLENSFMYPNVVLGKMIEEQVSGFAGVPSTFAILLNRSNMRQFTFPDLRYVTQAGGAMSFKHASELHEALPNVDIYIMYGQTEATARLTYLEPADLLRKPGSIGKAIPGVRITLRREDGTAVGTAGEPGEIVAEGDNIMQGYWNRPEETRKVLKADGLHTGDLARQDEDGYLYVIGRNSEMIKSGAHRISPKEIEEILLEIPEVHEVAVVGVPDTYLGEAINACIVLKDGRSVEKKDVLLHCANNLPHFKVPKTISFVESLPKTTSGKVMKHMIKTELAAHAETNPRGPDLFRDGLPRRS